MFDIKDKFPYARYDLYLIWVNYRDTLYIHTSFQYWFGDGSTNIKCKVTVTLHSPDNKNLDID